MARLKKQQKKAVKKKLKKQADRTVCQFTFLVNDKTYSDIKKAAKKNGCSMSAYCRDLIVQSFK